MKLSSDLPRLYTVDEVADLVHVHPQTVRLWIKTGQLDAYKVGRYHRISDDQLARFLDAHRQDGDR